MMSVLPSARMRQAISAALLLCWSSAAVFAQGQDPSPVEVDVAGASVAAATRWAPGTVISMNDARISAELSGRITWVAEVGDEIEQGGVLARIDDDALQLELLQNQARIQQLESQLTFQRNQHQRLRQLAKSNNVSSTQLDEAASQLSIIEQDLAQARIAGKQIQRRIELSTVQAPFNGRVVERMAQVGEFANQGTPMLRLVDTGEREIRVRAPVGVAQYVQPGMEVMVSQEQYQAAAEIRTVIPVADERSRMFELRLLAEDPHWVIGSAVRVALPISATQARVSIPRDAVIMRGQEMYVYVVDDANSAQRVDVRTGVGMGERVEVIGAVEVGDRLIVRGGERLTPGQEVTILSRNEPDQGEDNSIAAIPSS
jgi:RND family efflux transporter MFP subunit